MSLWTVNGYGIVIGLIQYISKNQNIILLFCSFFREVFLFSLFWWIESKSSIFHQVQYKKDCKKFYGRILDNKNVESSLRTKSKHQTKELWAKLYPGEPFELDCSHQLSDTLAEMSSGGQESITYDLVSAVKRQSSFYYQVVKKLIVIVIILFSNFHFN